MNTKQNKFSSSNLKIVFMILVLILLVHIKVSVNAAPNVDYAFKIGDVLILPDHLDAKTFYYLKGNVEIAKRDDVPKFNFTINRYIGKNILGDDGEFWVRGVVKFSTVNVFGSDKYNDVKRQLQTEYGNDIKLVHAPIKNSNTKLVYKTIAEQDQKEGELAINAISSEDGGSASGVTVLVSEHRNYLLGLQAHDSELFWSNFENNNLQLSVAFTWIVNGKTQDQNNNWLDSFYELNNAIPIQVSMQQYPQLFKRNELWQNVKVAHTNLMVHCYDFINSEDTDLYRVDVEIRFKTLNDDYYFETVRFTKNSDEYDQEIPFRLVSEFDKGFEFRVHRMTLEGEKTVSDWARSKGAFLDVTMPIVEMDRKLDVIPDEGISNEIF